MPTFPPIVVRQPQPHDIVDDPAEVCGIGVGFEGVVGAARVRDANGTALAEVSIHAGGTGIWGNFHVELPLGAVSATPQGALEVFGFHAGTPSARSSLATPSPPSLSSSMATPRSGCASSRPTGTRFSIPT